MSISTQLMNAEQCFFLNGEKLSGLSNVSIGYSNPLELSPTLGNAGFGFMLNGPTEATIEFNRFLIAADPVLNFTGDSSFSGAFNYGGRSYYFETGYLSSYSVSCGVGQTPEASSRISVFCGLKTGAAIQTEQVGEGVFIPSQRSISVSGMDFATNRVKQFNYSLEISRQPIYSIEGGRAAQSVNFILPVNVSATVEIDASNSNMRESYSFTEQSFDNGVNINIQDRTLTTTILDFPIPNAELISESLSSSADGQPSKTIQLAGYLV